MAIQEAAKGHIMNNHLQTNRSSYRRQAGVGMIEVLVALVISAFALLGLAGLQITSLRFQKTAHFRSLASFSTADIADRMRANVAGSASYVTTDTYLANPGATSGACSTTAGTIANVAARDLCEWRLNLKNTVNGGWGEIAGDVVNGFTITVYFNEPSKNDKTTSGVAQENSLDVNCRAAALSGTNVDVRCFKTVFLP
jgi:type IV pilus assembly protein PilV